MTFPAEAVPDGAVFAPHHYTYALLLVLLVTLVVWDNYRDREPLIVAAAAGMGLFGFFSVWPYYPTAGAILALGAPVVVIGAVLSGWLGFSVGGVWDDYQPRFRLAAIGFALLALDDAVEHAFGVWTPFDALWSAGLMDRAPTVVVAALALLVGGAVVFAVGKERR